MTRRTISRSTAATLALTATIGLSASVVAFGQDTTSVPLSDYTTPTTTTTTTTVPTTPPPPSTGVEPTTTSETTPARRGTKPSRTSGGDETDPIPVATPRGAQPQRLAFTGYDPILAGLLGLGLMFAAVVLQRRRRASQN